VGISVWQVTFESAFAAFESTDFLLVEATAWGDVAVLKVAAGTTIPPAAGALAGAGAVDRCSPGTQPQTTTLASTVTMVEPRIARM
jgi:hypothetical protein